MGLEDKNNKQDFLPGYSAKFEDLWVLRKGIRPILGGPLIVLRYALILQARIHSTIINWHSLLD